MTETGLKMEDPQTLDEGEETSLKTVADDTNGEEGMNVETTVKKMVEATMAHRTVLVESEESPFTRMGYVTWRCKECDLWRVPGAPFSLVGDARIFNATCSFGDTGPLCCNCERMKELLLWKGKTLQLYRKGLSSISPPMRLMDQETAQAVWDRDEHGMQAYVEIMKDAKLLESGASGPAWYAEMACNHCRARAGLKTHEEVARQRAAEAQQRLLDAADSKKKKKGKKGAKSDAKKK